MHRGFPDDEEKTELLVIRHDADCGYLLGAKVYSPLIDSIVELTLNEGFRVKSMASPYSLLVGRKAYNSPFAMNRSFFRISVLGFFIGLFKGKNFALTWKKIKRKYIWQKCLKRLNPRIVIAIGPDLQLCEAGKELGIKVYDLQHGSMSCDHRWYGKELQQNIPAHEVPNGFLLWDADSRKVLENWAKKSDVELHIIGNPWFARFAKPDQGDGLVQKALENGRIFTNNKPTVLVSLQWGLDYLYYENTGFTLMAESLKRIIRETGDRLNWLLRLHPVQLRGNERAQTVTIIEKEFSKVENLEWQKASSLPLPVVLAQTDLHITDFSSVTVEAAWYGIHSALLNPYLKPGEKLGTYYASERNRGIATLLAQKDEDIRKWIDENLKMTKEAYNCCADSNTIRNWITEGLSA